MDWDDGIGQMDAGGSNRLPSSRVAIQDAGALLDFLGLGSDTSAKPRRVSRKRPREPARPVEIINVASPRPAEKIPASLEKGPSWNLLGTEAGDATTPAADSAQISARRPGEIEAAPGVIPLAGGDIPIPPYSRISLPTTELRESGESGRVSIRQELPGIVPPGGGSEVPLRTTGGKVLKSSMRPEGAKAPGDETQRREGKAPEDAVSDAANSSPVNSPSFGSGGPSPHISSAMRDYLANVPGGEQHPLFAVVRAHDSFLMDFPPAVIRLRFQKMEEEIRDLQRVRRDLERENGLYHRVQKLERGLREADSHLLALQMDADRRQESADTRDVAVRLAEALERGESHLQAAQEDFRSARALSWKIEHPYSSRRRGRGPTPRSLSRG